jgi:hypothetical protein
VLVAGAHERADLAEHPPARSSISWPRIVCVFIRRARRRRAARAC